MVHDPSYSWLCLRLRRVVSEEEDEAYKEYQLRTMGIRTEKTIPAGSRSPTNEDRTRHHVPLQNIFKAQCLDVFA